MTSRYRVLPEDPTDDGRWSRNGWHTLDCWRNWSANPPQPCSCAAADVEDRMRQALMVAACVDHDEDGLTDEASGFPTCSKCGAILTERTDR